MTDAYEGHPDADTLRLRDVAYETGYETGRDDAERTLGDALAIVDHDVVLVHTRESALLEVAWNIIANCTEWYIDNATHQEWRHAAESWRDDYFRWLDGDSGGGGNDPIPMRLPCPSCGALHVDEGEFATKPHHTHACQACGEVWRPAVVQTVGVRFLPGFKDEVTK